MPKPIGLVARLNITGPHNIKPVVSAIQRQLSSINANINIKLDPKLAGNISNVDQRLSKFNTTITQTTASTKDFTSAITGLGSALSQLNSKQSAASQIQKTGKAAQTSAKQIKQASTEMERFGEQAALAIRRFTAFTVATGVIFGFVRAIQSATSTAIDFNKELTRVSQVSGLSTKNLGPLVDTINDLSIKLGVSSTELLSVSSTLNQAGLSITDTRKALEALAKSSLAPSFSDIKNTTEAVIAAMAQFELQAGDVEAVLGSINSVSAAFAAEAEDLTTVIRRVGGVFASAGEQFDDPKDSLNELLALFTSVRSTTRESAETIATGFRTIFSRLQRRSTIDTLRNYNIELTNTEGKFVGIFEAVKRLNQGLTQFERGDIELAGVLEELGGFRQISKTIPLIQQFAKAEEALAVAQKGQTSLTEDAIIAQESFANQIVKVREQFLGLIRDVSQSRTFEVITKALLGTASALIRVADTLQPVLPLLTALATIKLTSGLTQFVGGFIGGIRQGGGASAVGATLGGAATGSGANQTAQASTAVANSQRALVAALGNNTSQLQKLVTVMQALINRLGVNVSIKKFARGGLVPGTGSGDIVPANLEPGEFVVRKAAVRAIGAENLYAANKLQGGGEPDDFFANRKALKAQILAKPDAPKRAKGPNVILGSLSNPLFGGLFLQPSPNEDLSSVRSRQFSSLPVPQRGAIAKKLGVAESALKGSEVFSAFELNYIEPNTARALGESMDQGIRTLLSGLFDNFGGGFDLPAKGVIDSILRTSGLETATGVIFESFVNSLVGNVKESTGERFDVVGSSVNRQALTRLFGPSQAQFLDVKRTASDDTLRGLKSGSLFSKALSLLPNLPVSISDSSISRQQKISIGNVGSALSKRLAGGGRAGAGDIIPAMLEPGEFVLNRRSAARIGASALNAMNRVGFAKGGPVGMVNGGFIPDQSFLDTIRRGPGTQKISNTIITPSVINKVETGLQEFVLNNHQLQQVMKRVITRFEAGVTLEDAINVERKKLQTIIQKEIQRSAALAGRTNDPLGIRGPFTGNSTTGSQSLGELQKAGFVVENGRVVGSPATRSQRVANAFGFGGNLTQNQRDRLADKRARLGGAVAFAGFTAASFLEGNGPSGSAAASGITGALTIGGIAAQISGPFGLVAGAAAGLFSALDRYAKEISNIKIKEAQEALTKASEDIAKALSDNNFIALNQSAKSAVDALNTLKQEALNPSGVDAAIGGLAGQRGRQLGAFEITAANLESIFSEDTFDQIINKKLRVVDRDIEKAQTEAAKAQTQRLIPELERQLRQGSSLQDVSGGFGFDFKKLVLQASGQNVEQGLLSDKVFNRQINSLFDNVLKGIAEPIQESIRLEGILNDVARSVNLLTDKFDQLNSELEFQISNLEEEASVRKTSRAILAGADVGLSVSGRAERVFGNVRGASQTEVESNLKLLEGRGLDTDVADTVRSTKAVFEELPKILRGLDFGKNAGSVQSLFENSARSLFNEGKISEPIFRKLEEFAATITQPSEEEDKEFVNKLEVKLTEVLGEASSSAAKNAELFAKSIRTSSQIYVSTVEEMSGVNNKFIDTQLASIDIIARSNSLRAEGEGRRLSDRELAAPFADRVRTLGFDPRAGAAGLGGRLTNLTLTKQRLSQQIQTSGDDATVRVLADKLEAVNLELANTEKALKLFAEDTTLASVAQEKLSRAAELRSTTREIAGGLLGGNRAAFSKQLGALARFQAGDLSTLVTSFDDLSAAIELQSKFLRATGDIKGAEGVEKAFERGIGAVLGPDFAKLFTASRKEEEAARTLQKKVAEIQLLAAQETIKAQAALRDAIIGGAGIPRRASGGMISGPGTGRSDSILARVSNGEFIVNAAATAENRGLLEHINSRGGTPRFARGGLARRRASRRELRNEFIKARTDRELNFLAGKRARAGAFLANKLSDRRIEFEAARRDSRARLVARPAASAATIATRPLAVIRKEIAERSAKERAAFLARRAAEAERRKPPELAPGDPFAGFRRGGIVKRRRSYASGGAVSTGGGVMSLDSSSISSLNSFVLAANNLANSLGALQNIPTTISMTGNHTVEVIVNGGAILQNLLEGPLGGLIRNEIQNALSRYDKQLRG